MFKAHRRALLAIASVASIGLLSWAVFSGPLNASGSTAAVGDLPASKVAVGMTTPLTSTTGTMSGSDHAAHHPADAQPASEPITTTDSVDGVMMGDAMGSSMAEMMGSTFMGSTFMGSTFMGSHGIHADTTALLAEILDKSAGDLPVESIIGLGRVLGRMEGMGVMMEQMHGMMGGACAGMMGSSPHAGMAGMGDASDLPFDARFIDSMIEHHQGAIDMAGVVLEQGEHQELRDMAEAIITAQQGELEAMQAWRAEWYPDLEATSGLGMGMGQMSIPEDDSTPFDYRFLVTMISHHEGAIAMAELALQGSERQEIEQLAQAIIDAQQGEIAQMQTWSSAWFPELPLPTTDGMAGHAGIEYAGTVQVVSEVQAILDEIASGDVGPVSPEIAGSLGRIGGLVESLAEMTSCPMHPADAAAPDGQ